MVDAVTSAGVVDQFDTENRIAGSPSHTVVPTQHVPSRWTAAARSSGVDPVGPRPGPG